jgi:hypothetical protein
MWRVWGEKQTFCSWIQNVLQEVKSVIWLRSGASDNVCTTFTRSHFYLVKRLPNRELLRFTTHWWFERGLKTLVGPERGFKTGGW